MVAGSSEQGKDAPTERRPSASMSVRKQPHVGAHASAACANAAGELAYAGRKQRQGEPKCRAMALLTLDIDLAAMQLDERPGDVEAQPQPIAQAMQHLHARHAIEALEQVRLRLRRDARPIVMHLDARDPFFPLQPHADRTIRWAVLEGIRE